ncbi:FtsK/SpoIIIE domain-containing protein [Streptomyces sp. NPDC050085]|uniref:FtsK/SpoIIIE domain-containing protein n=1 Tax=Streptomyces sp. NPDC050085 TaxID=3365600 RepID=UPI0037BBC9E0
MNLDVVFGYAPYGAGLGIAVLLVWAVIVLVRYARADPLTRQSIRQARRIRWGWKRLARMANLSVTDKTPTFMASLTAKDGQKPEPRVLIPAVKTTPDRFGVIVHANCLPQVGLEEFQKSARFLADAWRCVRVSVAPAEHPGQVILRAVRQDPLATKTTHTPSGKPPADITRWELGWDEYATPIAIDLANVPGVTVAGLPGYGKTSFINRLICDFAPSPLVQIAVVDGKSARAEHGDYASVAPRLFRFVGDDLEAANRFFKEMVQLRVDRTALVKAVFGTSNMWHHGPTEDWPLVIVIVDEAHTFFRDYKGSDPATKKLAALSAENARLVEDLTKKGRSVGMLTIPATQKATGDALPTFIRDVCPVGLSFAQKTTDAAVAALGDDIRKWDDVNPITLQDPKYVGVAVMAAQNRVGFVRIRTPYVADADAERVAEQTAHLTRDPAKLLARYGHLSLDKTPPPDDLPTAA